MKIEHIGIAVKDLESSKKIFSALLNIQPYKTEVVASEGVKTLFFQTENTKIELLSATLPDSPIAKFISKRGEGMHHIAFHTDNIESEIIRLKNEGFEFIQEIPKAGADNKRIVFLHPKSTNGVLIEICENSTT